MGNIMGESAFNPYIEGDNGESFGLAQWRGARRDKLNAFAAKMGSNPGNLMVQLAFMLEELKQYGFSMDKMNRMSPEELVNALVEKYEVTGDFAGDTTKRIGHMRNIDTRVLEDNLMQSKNITVYNSKNTTINAVEQDRVAGVVLADNKDFGRQFNLGYEY